MKGFTDECLLLFPKPETVDAMGSGQYYLYKQAVAKIIKYINSIDMEINCFISDEVALTTEMQEVKWISTLPKTDLFFMMNNNSAMAVLKYKNIEPDDPVVAKSLEKYPPNKDNRFEIAVKRERMITRELIKKFKCVFYFRQKKEPSFSVTSEINDGRIVIFIDVRTLVPECWLSGTQMNPTEILAFGNANSPVHLWEVD